MILAIGWLFLIADAPMAPKQAVEYKPVRLKNGVEFHPSPEGFAFVKNGKVLKQYTYQELGGVPESPLCKKPYVRDFENGMVFVGYCLVYEGPESAGGYVGCYFTDEGEKKWCASGEFTDWPALDSLGRYFVGSSFMWPYDPIYVFTPQKRVVLEGRGRFDSDDVFFMDSGIVFGFGDLPIEVEKQHVSRFGRLGADILEEIVALVFRAEGIFVADTFIRILPGYAIHRAELAQNRVKVWLRPSRWMRPSRTNTIRVVEISLRRWEGDTLRIPEIE